MQTLRSELIASSLKRMSNQNSRRMLKEKAGETAGKIWNALNESEGLTAKQLKKALVCGKISLKQWRLKLY